MNRKNFIKIGSMCVGVALIAPLLLLGDKYKFEIETLDYVDALIHKPDRKTMIALDIFIKDLKKNNIWDNLEHISTIPPFLCCEYDANINLINPLNKIL